LIDFKTIYGIIPPNGAAAPLHRSRKEGYPLIALPLSEGEYPEGGRGYKKKGKS
jgi:hypothetical protein